MQRRKEFEKTKRIMKFTKLSISIIAFAALTACSNPATNGNSNMSNMNHSNTNMSNTNSAPSVQNLSEVPRPQAIVDKMKERGEQDEAKPTLKIVEPKADSTVNSST